VSNRVIIGAMGIAVVVLAAAGVYLAFFAGSGSAYSLPGSIDTNCQKYRTDNQHSAKIDDPIVKGIVDIGLVEGTKETQAAQDLKLIGTSSFLPFPYRENAFVCVQKGHEDEWAARLKTFDWVEWAHSEGVNPIDTLGQ